MTSFDRIAAGYIESAGNTVSGLILDEIGEDGHAVANKLWKIAAYLRKRNDGEGGVSEPAGDSPDRPPAGESRLPGGSDDYLPVAFLGDNPGDDPADCLPVTRAEYTERLSQFYGKTRGRDLNLKNSQILLVRR